MTRHRHPTPAHVTYASDAVMHLEFIIDIPVWAHDEIVVSSGVEVRPGGDDDARGVDTAARATRCEAPGQITTLERRTRRRRRPMRQRVLRVLAALGGLLLVMTTAAHALAQDADGDALEPHQLRARVAERAGPAIDACYTRARDAQPTVAGGLEVEFQISTSGTVDAARVATSTVAPHSDTLETCITEALDAVEFADLRPARAVRVRLPMHFEPARSAPGAVAAAATAQAAFRQRLRDDEAVHACLQRAQERDADLSGRLDVEFTIDGQGHISNLRPVASTLTDRELQRCALDAMADITVPAYKGGPTTIVQIGFGFAR